MSENTTDRKTTTAAEQPARQRPRATDAATNGDLASLVESARTALARGRLEAPCVSTALKQHQRQFKLVRSGDPRRLARLLKSGASTALRVACKTDEANMKVEVAPWRVSDPCRITEDSRRGKSWCRNDSWRTRSSPIKNTPRPEIARSASWTPSSLRQHGQWYDGYVIDVILDPDSRLFMELNLLTAGGDEAADAVTLIRQEEKPTATTWRPCRWTGGFNGPMLRSWKDPDGLAMM